MSAHVQARKPAAQRRREIVEAVLGIIGKRGLTALTTTAIAKEIGVTSGALFRHFSSRDAMLLGTVRYALGRIEETFPNRSLPPLERLLRLARNRIRLLGSDPGLAWLLRSEQAYLTLPEEATAHLRKLVRRSKRYLLDALREGAAEGRIRGDIEPEILILPVMGTIHALVGMPGIHGAGVRGHRRDADRVLAALERLLAAPAGEKRKHTTRLSAKSGNRR